MRQVPLKEAVGSHVNIKKSDGHFPSSNTDLEEQGTRGWTAFFGLWYGPDTGRHDHGNNLNFLTSYVNTIFCGRLVEDQSFRCF